MSIDGDIKHPIGRIPVAKPGGGNAAADASCVDGGAKAANRFGVKAFSLFDVSELNTVKTEILQLPGSALTGSVIINLLGLGLPLVILQVYDRVIPNNAYETLTMMMLGLVGVVIVEAFLRLSRAYVVGWSATQFTHSASIDAMNRFLNAPNGGTVDLPPSKINDRFNAIGTLGDFYGGQSRLILLDVPFMLVFLAVLFFVGGLVALVPIAIAVGVAIESARRGRHMRRTLEDRHSHDDKRYDFLMECLSGIQTLKALGMEPFMLRRFERLQETTARIHFQMIELTSHAQTTGLTLANASTVLMVSIGAVYAIQGEMTIGTLSCCTLLTSRMIQPMLRAIGVWNELQTIQLAYEHSKTLFDLPEPVSAFNTIGDAFRPEVRLSGVSFVQGANTLVESTDLIVEPGEYVAITGNDDGSKSALIDLIWGAELPSSGTVAIGGVDPATHRFALASKIGYVAEKPVMFKGSILDNMTLFGEGPSVDDVRWACRSIGVENAIHRLPAGYDTPLGDGGVETLPGGFLQRIAIARAIAKRPQLLLLDEPQAFLDSDSDRRLIEFLTEYRGNTTVIIATSRPSYFKVADRVFDMNANRLILRTTAPPTVNLAEATA